MHKTDRSQDEKKKKTLRKKSECYDNGNRVHCVFNITDPHRFTLTHEIS